MTAPSSPTERLARRPEAVLFDLFGTLIPTGSQDARIRDLTSMARVLGVDHERFARRWLDTFDERVRGRMGSLEQTIERLVRELGGTPSGAAVERAASMRRTFARSLFDGGLPSLPALDTLRGAGVRLALVSDTSDETVRVWPETAFALRFEVTVFSCVEHLRKPDPRMFATALQRLRLPPSACVFVGDGGSHELTGAGAAGISAFQYIFPGEESGAYRVDYDSGWHGTRLSDPRDLLRQE